MVQPLQSLFANPVTIAIVLVPLLLIACDLATGILRAFITKQFKASRIADFLGTSFVKYLALLIGIVMIWMVSGDAVATNTASLLGMGTLSVSIGASIVENIQTLGLPPAITQEIEVVIEDLEHITNPVPKKVVVEPPEVL